MEKNIKYLKTTIAIITVLSLCLVFYLFKNSFTSLVKLNSSNNSVDISVITNFVMTIIMLAANFSLVYYVFAKYKKNSMKFLFWPCILICAYNFVNFMHNIYLIVTGVSFTYPPYLFMLIETVGIVVFVVIAVDITKDIRRKKFDFAILLLYWISVLIIRLFDAWWIYNNAPYDIRSYLILNDILSIFFSAEFVMLLLLLANLICFNRVTRQVNPDDLSSKFGVEDLRQMLTSIEDLYKQGKLTSEEYQVKRKEIIDKY